MNAWRNLRARLFPPKPEPVIDDSVLGPMRWDAWTKSWISSSVASPGRYDFQIERFKRFPTPPAEALKVAHDLVHDPERLEWLLLGLLKSEAEKRPEPMRADILRLRITRITLRMESGVRGEMSLDGKPPLAHWFCYHSNGTPVGIAQQSD